MNETFYMVESARPPHPNNCPPGHYIAIANGGNGHWNGDGCCNDGVVPASSIDMGVSMLFVVAIGIISFIKLKS